jgi:hypothetical protein
MDVKNYPSDEDWANWAIETDIHKIFCLRWLDLFDTRTADTWQVRYANIKTICRELIAAADMVKRIDAYRGVLRSILDEACHILPDDCVITECYPFVSTYFKQLQENQISTPADANEVRHVAVVVLGNLADYWDNAVRLAMKIMKGDPKEKKKLHSATMCVATEAMNREKSPRYVRMRFLESVLVNNDASFLERLEVYFNELSEQKKTYHCLLSPEGLKHKDFYSLPNDMSRMGVKEFEEIKVRSPALERLALPATQGNHALKLVVLAEDPVDARVKAEKRVGEYFASRSLVDPEERLGIRPYDFLVATEDWSQQIGVPPSVLGSSYLGRYYHRMRKLDFLLQAQERLRENKSPDLAHLSAALEYHRLALLSTSEEARLTNLWIATEAICQGDGHSIIERVWTKVAPCVALNTIRRVLTSLSILLRFVWQYEKTRSSELDSEFKTILPDSSDERIEPEDLIRLLLKPRGHRDLVLLCRLCKSHPLLRFRLSRIHEELLQSPNDVAKRLDDSRKNIEWQIKRIYRVRNAVVHSGTTQFRLSQLTQNLYCYLVNTIESVLIDLARQPRWSISDSLEHRSRVLAFAIQHLKKNNPTSISSLLNPELLLNHQADQIEWANHRKTSDIQHENQVR